MLSFNLRRELPVAGPKSRPLTRYIREISARRFSDLLLIGITLAELVTLFLLTPMLALVDWIYVVQHLWVLGIAAVRPAPRARDYSLPTSIAVAISYAYPYAQVIYLNLVPGSSTSDTSGLIIVTLSACLSLASLLSLGKLFGVRPALRGLAIGGPYALVRHPLYLSYVLSDLGYALEESNAGTEVMMLIGWASLLYRLEAEERILSQDAGWRDYLSSVPYRLVPGIW